MEPMFAPASVSKFSSQAPKPYVNLTTDQISVLWVPVLLPTEGEQVLKLDITSHIYFFTIDVILCYLLLNSLIECSKG